MSDYKKYSEQLAKTLVSALEAITASDDYIDELEKQNQLMREALEGVCIQAIGEYNEDKKIMEYDHMCLSYYEDAMDVMIELGIIKPEQSIRG